MTERDKNIMSAVILIFGVLSAFAYGLSIPETIMLLFCFCTPAYLRGAKSDTK